MGRGHAVRRFTGQNHPSLQNNWEMLPLGFARTQENWFSHALDYALLESTRSVGLVIVVKHST